MGDWIANHKGWMAALLWATVLLFVSILDPVAGIGLFLFTLGVAALGFLIVWLAENM